MQDIESIEYYVFLYSQKNKKVMKPRSGVIHNSFFVTKPLFLSKINF